MGRLTWLETLLLGSLVTLSYRAANSFTTNPYSYRPKTLQQYDASIALPTVRLTMSSDSSNPKSFREAEVLGLRLMQEQKYDEALEGM